MCGSDNVFVRVVMGNVPALFANLASLVQHPPDRAPLTGRLACPRGCGTTVYWALSPELAGYGAEFLQWLMQQLIWGACPHHTVIESQMLPGMEQLATMTLRGAPASVPHVPRPFNEIEGGRPVSSGEGACQPSATTSMPVAGHLAWAG